VGLRRNFLSNAVKFTPAGGQVTVSLERDGVRHLVELHGGMVGATSRGRWLGATFTVTFPLASSHKESSEVNRYRQAEAGETPQSRAVSPDNLRDLRMLVADDKPDARDLCNLMLTSYGAEVRTRASAAEIRNIW
jgi:hypothetical protein